MINIDKVNGTNKSQVIDFIKQDVIKHVFAFYDIQYDPEHTTVHAAFENNQLIGYILIYTAADVPSIVIESEKRATGALLEHAPENNIILHAPPELLTTIKAKYPTEKHYVENWMLVRKNEANFFKSEFVKPLHTRDDALSLSKLLSTRKDRPEKAIEKYVEWVKKMRLYGVFEDGELVSYAGSFLQLPQVWMIGGVYTNPKHRNKGYATLAVSAITEEALGKAETAALFVRSDNYPAIKSYEKIGYKKIGEKLWVDVGTGMRP